MRGVVVTGLKDYLESQGGLTLWQPSDCPFWQGASQPDSLPFMLVRTAPTPAP